MIQFLATNWKEIVGIIASLFVLAAFLFKDIVWVRIIDCIGAIIYLIYGILINSISIIVLNSVLIIIQIYNLIKLRRNNGKN